MTTASVLLVLLLLPCSLAHAQTQVTLRELRTFDERMYFGEVPSQSWHLPELGLEMNIMYPPPSANNNDQTLFSPTPDDALCSMPRWLLSTTTKNNSTIINNTTHPICFLVSGFNPDLNCHLNQQVQTLQRIQGSVDSRVKCLLVYGDYPDTSQPTIDNQSVLVVYVPALAGLELIDHIQDVATETNTSPYYGDAYGANVNWKLPFRFQYPDDLAEDDDDDDSGLYYYFWSRMGFFAILSFAALLRVIFLWYKMGGRIVLRRNENGRIVGLRYIRPLVVWLSFGTMVRPIEPASSNLTEEQFESLPMISYMRHESQHGVEVDGEAVDSEDTEAASDYDGRTEGPSVTANDAVDQILATKCTMCSICLDDFESGELLVLLPRCQHAFHKECIQPWLTERQGCCPLCKTDVYEKQETDAVEDTSLEESRE